MKTLAIAASSLTTALAIANRPVEMTALSNLAQLEEVGGVEGTRDALTWVNENALPYLPVAATLRAEEMIAGVALRMAAAER
jgi:hypothetical protein